MKYLRTSKVLLSIFASCALFASCAHSQQPPTNIALGKTVTFNRPNYALCTDPGDTIQLTDGKYSEANTPMWKQKGTVGWSNTMPVVITIDLGSVQSISGVSYSTAAGSAGVAWPTAIYMATSDDDKIWHDAGNLIPLSKSNGALPAEGYQNFRYITHDLQTKGRYISFAVVEFPYAFADEIEVYKGNDAWQSQPTPGRVVSKVADLVTETRATFGAQNRLNHDIAAVRDEVQKSSVSPSAKSTFMTRLDNDATATAQMSPLPVDFKTILPVNDTHRDILAVHGELLAAQGQKPLTVWKKQRFDWLPFLTTPDAQSTTQLDFSMLGNQFRSDNLLLTNASGKSQNVTLQLKNAPRDARRNWLQVYSVAWTDTAQGTPVADALLPLDARNGTYTIEVPAGMTRKVWFTVDSSKVPAGAYKSTFVVNGAGQQTDIPLSVNVSKIAMNQPRFSLGMWDYTNGNGAYGITPENRKAAIAMMRSHYVDTPWAKDAALQRPDASSFDAQGNFIGKQDFSNFDQWVSMWPGARHYFVFPNVGDSFAGAKMGTPEFNARVGSWAKVLSAHMTKLGLKPSQLGLLLVDEPRSDARDAIIAAWAKAIKATAPEITLFEDPVSERPDQIKIQDSITLADVICPNLPIYKSGGEPVKKYFENLRAQGKKLWFYQCVGPVRLYSPQQYFRYQPWQAFSISATGEGFWAFGDTAGATTSWNEYNITRPSFAPAFIDKDTIYDSVHWDAVREGVEDYEELAMLQDAIKTSINAAWKTTAQKVLDNAVAAVTQTWTGNYNWQDEKYAGLADTQLQNVRNALISN